MSVLSMWDPKHMKVGAVGGVSVRPYTPSLDPYLLRLQEHMLDKLKR
jgi:hypothetical protein